MKRLLVFTDLDGTLLDQSYSPAAAEPALKLLAAQDIPLIFCSSKTRAEIEVYRNRLHNRHPFVSENGGGIFFPRGYFPDSALPPDPPAEGCGELLQLRLGAPYRQLRQALVQLRGEGFAISGFGDLEVADVAALTGLSLEQAALAKERDFDEPFLFAAGAAAEDQLLRRIGALGWHSTRGRLWHLLGASDKGRAVALLTDCYRARDGEVLTIGLGDQRNDFPMLEQVDIPILVRQPEGSYVSGCGAKHLQYSHQVGPAGWNEVLSKLLPALQGGEIP
ncbi:MAG: hypothetical protein A2005_04205 [Desulfuromonadales bacterium GWC2_61_20]|nr:MAG: hypothetical protein A2005_04205 [Desulfuromonadales bacterium GWC2_61_20]HAD04529.1 mannosyl-3-phosphoglycerate phosphatase [Desulfuromonas sp.]